MTDLPIIFSSPMVLALLREARDPGCAVGKTMTRRLAWTGKKAADGEGFRPSPWQKVKTGDKLWVREKALYWINNTGPDINKRSKVAAFAADGYELEPGERWTPSIHMERRFSRLTLIVRSTKIERLQDITEADARAEGCGLYVPGHGWITIDDLHADPGYSNYLCARLGFQDIWQTLHGPNSWDANPFVVAITFRPVLANIDSLKEQAA